MVWRIVWPWAARWAKGVMGWVKRRPMQRPATSTRPVMVKKPTKAF